MDSMRSLNTSLPGASSPRRRTGPPEQLMQVFKQAALSVTNLYKAAASEHDKAYREGYQDALEDLLSFLDKDNLGLQDGEGWSVRQWATERYDGTSRNAAANGSESEEEAEEEKRDRSSSPVVQKKEKHTPIPQAVPTTLRTTPHNRSESAPPVTASAAATTTRDSEIQSYTVPQGDFTFQSSHQFPVHEMEMDSPENHNHMHINVLPRNSRPSRQSSRTSRTGAALGHGAGAKRRQADMDLNFFTLGGFNGKDGFGGAGLGGGGGGKRGRFT